MKIIKSLLTGLAAIGIVLVVSESAMAANSQIAITTQNLTIVTITPSSLNYTGTVLPIPSNINAAMQPALPPSPQQPHPVRAIQFAHSQ